MMPIAAGVLGAVRGRWTVFDHYSHRGIVSGAAYEYFGVLFVLLLVVLAVVAAMGIKVVIGVAWHYRVLRRMRRPAKVAVAGPPVCGGCGYDLRASRGRCPECGREIPAPLRARRVRPIVYRGFVGASRRGPKV